jgi:hypothetical protein
MKRLRILLILVLGLVTLNSVPVGRVWQAPAIARAQTSSTYDLSWGVVSAGGGRGTSARYALESAVGQPAAGPMSSASYGLAGGYLVHSEWWNFIPVVMKNYCSGGWEIEPNNTDLVANAEMEWMLR